MYFVFFDNEKPHCSEASLGSTKRTKSLPSFLDLLQLPFTEKNFQGQAGFTVAHLSQEYDGA